MKFYTETLDLPHKEFLLLRDLIHEQTGISFEADKKGMLVDKLMPLVLDQGMETFLDYYYLLKYESEATNEWKRVCDALSVPETFFGREIDQVRTLVEVLMPRHVAANADACVKIWSAACATGEEPLSIAMALNEAGWFDRADIEIHASDFSQSALEKAKSGLYGGRSFRQLPSALKQKYFSNDGELLRIAPELHTRIQWHLVNLKNKPDVVPRACASFIFCRNVFIYFSEEAIRNTVRIFYEQMPTPGYLFSGLSESLLKHSEDFEMQEIGNAFVYVKN